MTRETFDYEARVAQAEAEYVALSVRDYVRAGLLGYLWTQKRATSYITPSALGKLYVFYLHVCDPSSAFMSVPMRYGPVPKDPHTRKLMGKELDEVFKTGAIPWAKRTKTRKGAMIAFDGPLLMHLHGDRLNLSEMADLEGIAAVCSRLMRKEINAIAACTNGQHVVMPLSWDLRDWHTHFRRALGMFLTYASASSRRETSIGESIDKELVVAAQSSAAALEKLSDLYEESESMLAVLERLERDALASPLVPERTLEILQKARLAVLSGRDSTLVKQAACAALVINKWTDCVRGSLTLLVKEVRRYSTHKDTIAQDVNEMLKACRESEEKGLMISGCRPNVETLHELIEGFKETDDLRRAHRLVDVTTRSVVRGVRLVQLLDASGFPPDRI